MTTVRKFGPRGFTRTPEVRAILDPLEHAWRVADTDPDMPEELRQAIAQNLLRALEWAEEDSQDPVPFDGLAISDARRLLGLLPARQRLLRRQGAPSCIELVTLGERFPDLRLHGYRVPPACPDESIVLAGFDVPAEQASEVLAALVSLPSAWDEVSHECQRCFRASWD